MKRNRKRTTLPCPFQQSESSDINYSGFFKNRRHELPSLMSVAWQGLLEYSVLYLGHRGKWILELPGSMHWAK